MKDPPLLLSFELAVFNEFGDELGVLRHGISVLLLVTHARDGRERLL